MMLLRERSTETNDRPGLSATGITTMTKIAKTAATVIALTLAAHASSAYAGTLTNAPKTATVTPSVPKIPTVIPSAPKATLPTIIPTVSNVASNIPASTGFGTGVWQSQSVTTRNPVTGLQASSLSRLIVAGAVARADRRRPRPRAQPLFPGEDKAAHRLGREPGRKLAGPQDIF